MGIKQLYEKIQEEKKINEQDYFTLDENIEDIVEDLTTQAQRKIADKGDEAEDDMDLGIEMINDQEEE